MRRYVLKRLLWGVVTLIGVSIIIFVAARLSGDVALLLAPMNATEAELQIIRERLGLDQPIPVQYYIFVKDALRGDFGESILYSRPAMSIILERLPATLLLGIASLIIGNSLGVCLGIVSATRRGTWADRLAKAFALLGQAIPDFWIAVMLVLVFSVTLHWFPTSGIGGIEHLVLPVLALSSFQVAFALRLTRSSLLDVLDSEYVKLARIKGNPEWVVIWKHALRNALIPVVTMAGFGLTMLIGGSVFVETVFRWPGIGSLLVGAITTRDYALVQAITLVIATGVIIINLAIDLVFVVIDPRIRYE